MKNYHTFEQMLGRVKYGTDLRVVDEFSHKELLARTWDDKDRVAAVDKGLRDAEVTSIAVEGGKLLVGVVPQEAG